LKPIVLRNCLNINASDKLTGIVPGSGHRFFRLQVGKDSLVIPDASSDRPDTHSKDPSGGRVHRYRYTDGGSFLPDILSFFLPLRFLLVILIDDIG